MVKVDLISGFLGAGKTTLIQKLLKEVFQNEKVVLIENEYGEVGIDGGFLKEAGIEIKELNSGCICCTLVGDFTASLREVVEKYQPDRILIEPTGVGKLSDVMKSVKRLEEELNMKLNALVTVVNAKKAVKQMRAFGEFFNDQILNATTIVLSRTQEMTQEQIDVCVKTIQEVNPKAKIITTPWDELKGDQILAVVESQKSFMDEMMEEFVRVHANDEEHEHHHHHHHHHHHRHGEDHEEHEHDDHDHEEHEHDDHDHDEHEHHHDHDHEEHEHHHDHDHEEHEHHHDHDHEEHEHHHDHEEHEHHHHHDHDHEHHHDHDHDGHDHDADEVFISWGAETPHKYTREKIENILKIFVDTEEYGEVLRAKGMVPAEDGTWIYFDMVPGDYELREGSPEYTGRLCVIGTDLDEDGLDKLFELV